MDNYTKKILSAFMEDREDDLRVMLEEDIHLQQSVQELYIRLEEHYEDNPKGEKLDMENLFYYFIEHYLPDLKSQYID